MAVFLCASTAAAQNDASTAVEGSTVFGRWITHRGGEIELGPCAGAASGQLCGFVAKLLRDDHEKPPTDVNNPDPALRDRPMLGLPIFFNFRYDPKDDRWEKGRVYNPENGKIYKAKLKLLDQNRLRAGGCWWIFCRTYEWRRAPEATTDESRPARNNHKGSDQE